MSLSFSYRHLYYFWVVAKEGGISRAAARLDMAVQTVSTQVRELEPIAELDKFRVLQEMIDAEPELGRRIEQHIEKAGYTFS